MKLEVKTRSGAVFFVDAEPTADAARPPGERVYRDGGLEPRGQAMGRGDVIARTETMFSRAVDVIRSVSDDVTSGLLDTDTPPSEVELSLNLGFDAGGNVWIFKGGANANLKLVLKWRVPGGQAQPHERQEGRST